MDTQYALTKLRQILSLARPNAGKGIEILMEAIKQEFKDKKISEDAKRNLHIDNRSSEHDNTMFLAHLDTVHRRIDGPVKIVETEDRISTNGPECLGADDGTGIAIVLSLLKADVKGYYVFTQDEEGGATGASVLDKLIKEGLKTRYKGIKHAVEFDRRGTNEVITHQLGQRCCSDAYGQALANALNDNDKNLKYVISSHGVYTDSAFLYSIPNRVNIAVGYFNPHGPGEYQLLGHFKNLVNSCLKLDWNKIGNTA